MTNTYSYLPETIDAILAHPKQKPFSDLRDRAAFIFITGCMPTHLRAETYDLLRLVTQMSRGATSLDGRHGTFVVIEEIATRLHLEDHPMVTKVRRFIDKSYLINVSRGHNSRRPYSKIFLSRRGDARHASITVQRDGSVLDDW